MYRSYVRSLSILEQAKMGLLDDYLTFQEISTLTYPDGMPASRKKLQKELLEYYECGKLIARKGAYDEALNALVLPGISHKEAFPRTGIKSDYWVHCNDFREFLEINEDWPVEEELLLAKWFLPKPQRAVFYRDIDELPEEQRPIVREKWQISEPKNDKVKILPQTRINELQELVNQAYEELKNITKSYPKAREVWKYIQKHQEKFDLIKGMDSTQIVWNSWKGTEKIQQSNSFSNMVTEAKKVFLKEK